VRREGWIPKEPCSLAVATPAGENGEIPKESSSLATPAGENGGIPKEPSSLFVAAPSGENGGIPKESSSLFVATLEMRMGDNSGVLLHGYGRPCRWEWRDTIPKESSLLWPPL
jgi:hypothetical protein